MAFVLCAGSCLLACSTRKGSGTIDGVDQARLVADRQHAQAPFEEQARLAVLRESSLNESHFSPGTARLTARGERDIATLADAMADAGGRISVERGFAGDMLYNARLESVRRALAREGIAPERVLLSEAGPGGQGVYGVEAMRILDIIRRDPMNLPSAGILSTSTSGGVQ
jgi:hypothetical protein